MGKRADPADAGGDLRHVLGGTVDEGVDAGDAGDADGTGGEIEGGDEGDDRIDPDAGDEAGPDGDDDGGAEDAVDDDSGEEDSSAEAEAAADDAGTGDAADDSSAEAEAEADSGDVAEAGDGADADAGCASDADCDDLIDCTVDRCESDGTCSHTADDALCDDGNPCNGAETCNTALGCLPGAPPACDDGIACTDDSCDPLTGMCIATPVDSRCDDGLVCNGAETCDAGSGCLPGTPVVCGDAFFCTVDSCEEPLGTCTFVPSDVLCGPGRICEPALGGCVPGLRCTRDLDCSDGLFCNGAERCVAGLCESGIPPDCTDADPCTTERCDEATASCVYPRRDQDADTYGDLLCGGLDCDDLDATIFPGAVELCDGLDNDCDGFVDEDFGGWGAICTVDSFCCSAVCGYDGLCDFGPPICEAPRSTCASAVDCCHLVCDPTTLTCETGSICDPRGVACLGDVECCSDRCTGGVCVDGGGGCRGAGAFCTDDHNCCSTSCVSGACLGPGPPCRVTGDTCMTDSECCYGRCIGRRCERGTFCRVAGEPCSVDSECCLLNCGPGGYCEPLAWCRSSYETCATSSECCVFRCRNDSWGFKRCLPIGGCRTSGPPLTTRGRINLYGEICSVGWECCSGICEADGDGVMRCRKAGNPVCGQPDFVCLPRGEICETDCQCCEGRCVEPRPPDPLGPYPKRCVVGTFPVCLGCGLPCGDPGECCSGQCVRWSDSRYRCCHESGTCVPAGGDCTTTSDCCPPLSCIPSGSRRICGFLIDI
ncbi:MAG: putative metal-binding motif-containing protein [Myxococcota bacterium]|nr:putative metal-binding motif-containing protein [Myxococcota bacterium]